mgnify:CR=1 FL=1
MRKKMVAGNWKMNKTRAEAVALVEEIQAALGGFDAVETVVCVPFTDLDVVGPRLKGTPIGLGAQNVHWEKSGAFTGEISAAMLVELGCAWVIVGHSERRQYFGETDETVNRRARAALAAGVRPIVCVGETLEERDRGVTAQVVETQTRRALADFAPGDWTRTVIAYEPVWAIGTGRTATPQQAQEVHALIRRVIAELAGEAVAAGVRVLYGGSMKPSNARELMGQPDIDGGLIGGAALEAKSFVDIVRSGA